MNVEKELTLTIDNLKGELTQVQQNIKKYRNMTSKEEEEKRNKLKNLIETKLSKMDETVERVEDNLKKVQNTENQKKFQKQFERLQKTLQEAKDDFRAPLNEKTSREKKNENRKSLTNSSAAAAVHDGSNDITEKSSNSGGGEEQEMKQYQRGKGQVKKLDEALDLLDDAVQRLQKCISLNEETLEIGRRAGEMLAKQTEHMKQIKGELDDMGAQIKEGNKLLGDIKRRLAGDICIVLVVILIILAIIVLVILKIVCKPCFSVDTFTNLIKPKSNNTPSQPTPQASQ